MKKIVQISKKEIDIQYNKTKPSIPFNMFLNNKKAFRELGWKPKVTIDDGIKKTIKWWKSNIQ